MRDREYPGSDIVIEQTLTPASSYARYIASYKSDGYKIFALLTIPNGPKPKSGCPVVVFNHGYIPPSQYRTTERYLAYTDTFSRNGYIVFKSDYRGHGNSEGPAAGGYGSPDYSVDVLNAISSLKRYPDVDPARMVMWGHSMGGQVTLRAMVISKDIKAGVIWAGVVAPYSDIATRWFRGSLSVSPTPTFFRGGWRNSLVRLFGAPDENPDFWNLISPNSYLKEISGPLQLHHDTQDHEVPYAMSELLYQEMKDAGQYVELFSYAGDDHNIAAEFDTAITRSLQFFNKYVK